MLGGHKEILCLFITNALRIMARYKKYYNQSGFKTYKPKKKKTQVRKRYWTFESALQEFIKGKLSVEKYREIVNNL